MSVIDIKNVTKKYSQKCALDNISLKFKSNKIYGLLGRNGAGKTTLLNLITNRIFPTKGKITIDGEDVTENDNAISKIYYTGEENLYPESFKIKKIFKWTKEFFPNLDINYAYELCEKFELDPDEKIKELSTGYNSISKLIVSLASNAEILFFDEPVLGLDAYHRDLFYKELLANYIKKPKTVILSTHIIDEIVDILERVVILKNKKIAVNDSLEDLLNSVYCISGPAKAIEKYIADKDLVYTETLTSFKAATIKGVMSKKDEEKVKELNLKVSKVELQKLFIHLTKGRGNGE